MTNLHVVNKTHMSETFETTGTEYFGSNGAVQIKC